MTNQFTGALAAQGGSGASYGGAGTVLTMPTISTPGQVVVDNGGNAGAHTTWSDTSAAVFDMTVSGGAILAVVPQVGARFYDLEIASNSWLISSTNYSGAVAVSVRLNADIQPGGGISFDGLGFPGNAGPGSGRGSGGTYGLNGGGGYGGLGGAGLGGIYGGTAYGDLLPGQPGSGGGGTPAGGPGGGLLELTVGALLNVQGSVSANGGAGPNPGSGGGAGGGILLTAGTLSGSGVISANGGAGDLELGGGGGGGRIGIFYGRSNLFTGTISAHGGSGEANGGAGTVYFAPVEGVTGEVIVDNAGASGPSTPLGNLPNSTDLTLSLTLSGSASGVLNSSPAVGGRLNNLWIAPNSWLYFSNPTPAAASLTLLGNGLIASGAGIILDGAGYAAGTGSGAGRSSLSVGGGGGNGGNGGAGATNLAYGGAANGSVSEPTTMGGGGGIGTGSALGGVGGGALRLNVNGTLEVEGVISAKGLGAVQAGGGGGAGGSLWLMVGELVGSGLLSANGGYGDAPLGGGGGGGRIAISSSTNVFTGSFSATGGAGANAGGAGTIYLISRTQGAGQLIVDNGGKMGATTPLTNPSSAFSVALGGGAIGLVNSSLGQFGPVNNFFIGSNSWLSYSNSGLQTVGMLSVRTNATIQSGGGILLDGLGWGPQGGSAAGRSESSVGGGGGNAGNGGAGATNLAYGGAANLIYGGLGNFSNPEFVPGSGGGNGVTFQNVLSGGAGGGALQLSVAGTLELDGVISANGTAGIQEGGGGAGGSLVLKLGQWLGSGALSANGGAGSLPAGGGGGGGVVAVYFATNLFTGAISAKGGAGANYGGAGAIYLGPNNNGLGQLVIDNGGHTGAATPLFYITTPTHYNLTVSGGALAIPSVPPQLGPINNFLLGANSMLLYSNSGYVASLTITNATIQAGGAIVLDGLGNIQGPGVGFFQTGGGGGGGYGGTGGAGAVPQASGGMSYGSFNQPSMAGSGGGSTSGAPGGGALELNASGTLQLDGRISANGASPTGSGGGDSGGGLWLTVSNFSGSGTLSANGGAALPNSGGGGGGGRIAIYYTSNQFAGTISAYGGSGVHAGGAGTIYMQNKMIPGSPQLVVDNGGSTAPNITPLNEVGSVNLTVTGGAMVTPGFEYGLLSLVIGSNSWLVYSNAIQEAGLSINRDATIQKGGGIRLDGAGFSGNDGPGFGRNLNGMAGGGGYGGCGGAGATNGALGGPAYGSFLEIEGGSGGGYSGSSSLVGIGGGGLLLNILGTLELDGIISANGTSGFGGGNGGGSGGGIELEVGRLSGAGVVSANGGAGDAGLGGGGGGGRIYVTCHTNLFLGQMVAQGGAGAHYGGAGTVYILTGPGPRQFSQLVVDNGGPFGTNTPLGLVRLSALTVSDGAEASVTGGTVGDLLVGPNASLTSSNGVGLLLTVTNNSTILASGTLNMDRRGFLGGAGPGGGRSVLNPSLQVFTGSGAGYGGNGGNSIFGAPGGPAYGSINFSSAQLQPPQGSGGGGGFAPQTNGGPGGGALELIVNNTLLVDGVISANGGAALAQGYGGGSGGSLWLNVGTLAGNGTIAANGGDGDADFGGGGGGGRIVLDYNSNQFSGTLSARGGSGANYGGAGTIYSRANGNPPAQVIVDNGGSSGAATPLSTSEAFDLTVSGAAALYPTINPLVLDGLAVNSGATIFGGLDNPTNFNPPYTISMLVLGNAVVASNASISVDNEGYNGTNAGPGAGQMSTGSGSGGGYGGAGGNSASGVPGGTPYGSATQPTNWGSSGGLHPVYPDLCQGAGAIRLMVASNFTLNGTLAANGNSAFFPGAGGGAGGSIWITTRELDGQGNIHANGGAGFPGQGGGGGGGRIAINSRANNFTGQILALAGGGALPGQKGTVVLTNIPAPEVTFQSPSDVVYYAVSNVVLTFGSPMDFSLLTGANLVVDTPNGELPGGGTSVSSLGLYQLEINFPAQNTVGYYDLQAGPPIKDIYGLPLLPEYVGSFIMLPPLISGQVIDTNGQPVPYVTLHVSGDPEPALTDTNGQYVIEVLPSFSGTITPSKGEALFIPPSRSYTNVAVSFTNQNFVMASPVVMTLSAQSTGSGMILGWYGINGVSYQTYYSTDMVHWLPYGGPIVGTNGAVSMTVPLGTEPVIFFRFSTSYSGSGLSTAVEQRPQATSTRDW